MKRFLLIFLAVLIIGGIGIPISAAPSRMGYVELKNGNIIYGEVIRNDSEEVVLRYEFGQLAINKVFVKSVEKASVWEGKSGEVEPIPRYPGPRTIVYPGTGKLPAKPGNPTPADSATSIALDQRLSWRGVSGATGYIVRFANTGVSLDGSDAANPNQSGAAFDPGTLKIKTQYHWRVDWVDSDGAITSGPVWTFTTVKKPPKEVKPEEKLLGDPKTSMEMRFTIRGPRGWIDEWVDIEDSSKGDPRKVLVFRDLSEKGIRRIIVGRMKNIPRVGSERKEFLMNLLANHDRDKYIPRGEGEFDAPIFKGETLYLEGSIGQQIFRCNFYFGEEYTYVLMFFAPSEEFDSLRETFERVAKRFSIR